MNTYGKIEKALMKKLLQDLPESLQAELSMSLKRDLIAKVPFFQQADDALIKDIAGRLKPGYFHTK